MYSLNVYMPIKYKNLSLLVTMSKRKRMLDDGLKIFKRFDFSKGVVEVTNEQTSSNKSIILYKKPKTAIILYK